MPAEWFNLTTTESIFRLDSDAERGLDSSTAQARLLEHDRNELQEGSRDLPAVWQFRAVGHKSHFPHQVLVRMTMRFPLGPQASH